MAEEKQVKYDIDGYDIVTTALRELLNQYPALDGEEITFSVLDEEAGIAMYPVNGAVIESEKENILGRVTQVCLYPFYIIYRAAGLSEDAKVEVKEWLDNLGRWLEQEEISVDGESYKLSQYPPLKSNREFKSITRQTAAYLDTVNENQSENWAIHLLARYQNQK